jgi:hypothetical protein
LAPVAPDGDTDLLVSQFKPPAAVSRSRVPRSGGGSCLRAVRVWCGSARSPFIKAQSHRHRDPLEHAAIWRRFLAPAAWRAHDRLLGAADGKAFAWATERRFDFVFVFSPAPRSFGRTRHNRR